MHRFSLFFLVLEKYSIEFERCINCNNGRFCSYKIKAFPFCADNTKKLWIKARVKVSLLFFTQFLQNIYLKKTTTPKTNHLAHKPTLRFTYIEFPFTKRVAVVLVTVDMPFLVLRALLLVSVKIAGRPCSHMKFYSRHGGTLIVVFASRRSSKALKLENNNGPVVLSPLHSSLVKGT